MLFKFIHFSAFQERRAEAIDMDNLDEELEKFLEQDPVDHNFALNRRGERIITYS